MGTLPQRVIAVVGQTGTGKTPLGVNIAKELKSTVISADSQLIYRGLTIGTAKPTLAEMQGIPHRMIDCCHPDEVFSVSQYKALASGYLKELWTENKVPVVVGGTGFYIQALLQGIVLPEVPVNQAFRQHYQRLAQEKGQAWLHQELVKRDPNRAEALHPNDTVRIIRALEIIDYTGQPVPTDVKKQDLDILWIGLYYADWDNLVKALEIRIDNMLAAGWLEEVQGLVQQYGETAHALTVSHGYPELIAVLKDAMTLEMAKVQIAINVRQYARRQKTWFKRNKAIQWFAVDQYKCQADLWDIIETQLNDLFQKNKL
ncbi:MAG: tRNA (adenosine(37)-N6)-dimethylallyltransferase MiaA [Cyanobacteria bacterium P01_H01_bin.74]